MNKSDDIIRIASFDIGVHNFSCYIEEINIQKLKNLICPKFKTDKNREPTEDYQNFLNKFKKIGKRIFSACVDLSIKKGVKFDIDTFLNLSSFLNTYKDKWNLCSTIVIEQQVKRNYMAQKLEQHVISWFSIYYKTSINIVIYPARHKYFLFGCAKKVIDKKTKKLRTIKPKERKNWASKIALDIFTCRKDLWGLEFINKLKKKDDIADCIIQLSAYVIQTYC